MKTIGILTSGGDAPGMNAAIRAITRSCCYKSIGVRGIHYGFDGLMKGIIEEMNVSSVADIIQKGGTILGTARSEEFKTLEGQKKALKILEEHGIDGLVLLGGDGSFKGGLSLAKLGMPVVGIPCTIDNDMGYTQYSIGFHTAVETVIGSIGKIRDTSSSHGRANIIEVMGRNCGNLALNAGFAGGAESIIVPERELSLKEIAEKIIRGRKRGKRHHLITVAEGVVDPYVVKEYIENETGVETKVTVLGHVQRGGSPSFTDAKLGSLMGAKAVDLLSVGMTCVAVGLRNEHILPFPLEVAVRTPYVFDNEMYEIAKILSN